VGMLDIEPIRIVGDKIRLRAGLYTGEPIDGNKLKVGMDYSRPYGDMNFIDVDGLTLHGLSCDNIIPEDNAAFDLSGRFYNNGTYDVYAFQNTNLYTFNGSQWIFNQFDLLNPYGVPTATSTDKNPWWRQMYTYINIHKENWPLKYTYKQFYGNLIPGRRSGEIEVIHEDGTRPIQVGQITKNSDILPNLDILHGYTTKFKIDMNFWPVCSHDHFTEQGPNGEMLANSIFYRDYSFFDAGAHSVVKNCISGCEFNDMTDWYTLAIRDLSNNQGPYLIPNMSGNKSMVGAEVHPCFFIMYTGLRDNVPDTRRNHFGLAHFLFPTYGDKVNFMKD
jgi:hypothetical protein